ncbi:golgin subfamily A member 5-like isoform X1 [Homarus americanus]|uniref:golgin subfamily A member 5-like isoform X1 n=1 Tax=Homarus americanus TaxID=6706 RepID=UPI001C48BD78|nr:golgin subfamily A member 5-like isoform X1 [Homarus americanus]XP_042210630.1 golgin subfamily A member 5-like isoform X1 [Homarus americanus]XP_042210631.1 golgin subfamily A member 5-like isoform X1 [Homarus americanus]
MSWITDLAGRAENLLNKLDSEAATVLSNERRSSVTMKSSFKYDAASSTPPPTKHERSGLHSSSSVPSNLSSYGISGPSTSAQGTKLQTGQGTSLTSSPKATVKKNNSKKKDNNKEEELMDFLNSPIQQENQQQTTMTTQQSDPMVSSTTMTISTLSSLGHSRQSSVSSASSLMALSGRETPGSATIDIESGSCGSGSGGSANTDAYVTVDTPTDVNISAPPSTDGSTSSNGIMTGSIDSETNLLRKEVSSLNQEMSQVLRRAKDAEREVNHLRTQVSGMSSQQSTFDRIIREVQQREMDLQESLRAKDSQLAVLRVRLQEADQNLETRDAALKEMQAENKRLLEGANESSGLHNHALQTLQDRLTETQGILDRERQQHSSAYGELTKRINQLEEEQQGVAIALSEAQRKLEDEKSRTHQLMLQVSSLRGDLVTSREELTEYKAKAGRILQSKEKLIATLKDRDGGVEGSSGGYLEIHEAELHQIRAERDLLREELEGAGSHVRQLMTEISDMDAAAQDQATLASQNALSLEESLAEERKRRMEVESELRQIQEELRCAHEELTRQKVHLSSRLQERDTEIDRLRKQVAHKQSSSSSQGELEQRVHGLTESLIHKQNSIETLSTEKHSLIIQMERLQQQYQESQKMLNRDPPTLYRQDDVRNRVPSFLVESPFDGGVTRQVKRAYSTLDKFSVRLGVFLRRYPIARVFVIVYMCLLHVWVMIVLLTYTPEIHGPDYHHPVGTVPHI